MLIVCPKVIEQQGEDHPQRECDSLSRTQVVCASNCCSSVIVVLSQETNPRFQNFFQQYM